jgi:3D (Asp-Asp-Asp) domain-containing protein
LGLLTALALQIAPIFVPMPPSYPPFRGDCRTAQITGYIRGDGSPWTADGTSIWTDEAIAAASYDVPMGSRVSVEGLGSFRIADRGRLSPTWIDVAVWTRDEAYALTGVRRVCIAPPDYGDEDE